MIQANLPMPFPRRLRHGEASVFPQAAWVWGLLIGSALLAGLPRPVAAQERPPQKSPVFARINGEEVTAEAVQLDFFLNQLPENATPGDRLKLLNRVIDRELIKRHLKASSVHPEEEVLEQEVNSLLKLAARRGESPDDVLNKMKLTRAGLRELLWVDAGWKTFMNTALSRSHLIVEWERFQPRYDGTRLRASQIVFLVPPDAPSEVWDEAIARMWELSRKIDQKELTFAEAARQHSQSPSGRSGGDLGEFEYRGRVDEAISRVAFRVKTGDLSDPFRTRFGVHLLLVTERIPGQLSLEDARPEIVDELSRRLWEEAVRHQRERFPIEVLLK